MKLVSRLSILPLISLLDNIWPNWRFKDSGERMSGTGGRAISGEDGDRRTTRHLVRLMNL